MKITEENFIEQMKKENERALEYVIENYGWIFKTVLKKHLFYIMDHYDVDLKFSNIKDINLDEDIDIRIVLKDIRSLIGESNKIVITKGKWEFEFKANGRELNKGTYALPMDYSFNVDEQKYILNEYSYNPIKQRIYLNKLHQ